jgi:uncharacterized protein (DUF2461 family)
MTFQGFPKETVRFLAGLRAHNEKEWFEAHRDDYQRFLKHPADLRTPKIVDFVAKQLAAVSPIHRWLRGI